ncbi:uncharacterized protein LOC130748096 isoform X3 [Lotus japonicus]|uniref:uncharacterized protein LOC130748096 isoform X3 n=1 Tax=Lotus japonicus TaxID=34305 RepID=UPI002589FCC1|nr:uncharacterized protein LOC130748096 isoform X3 [Lotus japonicus]
MMPSAATLLYALLFPLLYALLDPLLLLPCRVCSSSTTFSFSTAFCSYPSISYALSSTLLVPMDITLQMHFEHDGGAGAEGGAASSRLHSEDSEGHSVFCLSRRGNSTRVEKDPCSLAYNPIIQSSYSALKKISASRKRLIYKSENTSREPYFKFKRKYIFRYTIFMDVS